ncbi:F-box domain containing protein [Pandoravirus dulcis]|uniref:F-box domain containing protein n=1 Tax=Pandoravirus dulcis TaxID=1349409 RepID=S4VP12_9VIRU|nr:F-box domain containing protein [Pandoravirus dulcis]AGO81982.1 F-box domain containing protein [Pandoravirus dulcis]
MATTATATGSMDNLPPELVEMVLKFARGLNRVSCARVCRLWRAVINRTRRPSVVGTWGRRERALLSVEAAAMSGHEALIAWAHNEGCPWDARAPRAALAAGHRDLFCRLVGLGCPWEVAGCLKAAGVRGDTDAITWITARSDPIDRGHTAVLAPIARAGHLDALVLAKAHCQLACDDWCACYDLESAGRAVFDGRTRICRCATEVMRKAAAGGHVQIMEWLWNCGYACGFAVCVAASRGGHIEALEWMAARGVLSLSEALCAAAADRGQLAVLAWLHAAGRPWDDRVCLYAAARGRRDIVEWATARGCPWHPQTTATAAARGHLAVAEWCLARGCGLVDLISNDWPDSDYLDAHVEPDAKPAHVAARMGRVDALAWLRDHGCDCADLHLFVEAAECQSLDVLDWVHANCRAWDAEACACVAGSGWLAGLQHMRAAGCLWDARVCTEAVCVGALDVLAWARANGCPWEVDAILGTVSGRSAPLLCWLIDHGIEWRASLALRVACARDEPDFFEWLMERGLDWDPTACATRAARDRHHRTVDLIVDRTGIARPLPRRP